VRVRTADGRLSVEVPVQIDADNEAGSIGEITVQTLEDAPSSPVAAKLASFGAPPGSAAAQGRAGEAAGSARSKPAKKGRTARGNGVRGNGEAKGYGEVRVDLDASFRAGLSAGTLTLSGVEAAGTDADREPGYAQSAPLRELASGRWTR
jgi:hypothetical protein